MCIYIYMETDTMNIIVSLYAPFVFWSGNRMKQIYECYVLFIVQENTGINISNRYESMNVFTTYSYEYMEIS